MNCFSSRRALTLIEVLMTVAVLILLAVFLLPALSRAKVHMGPGCLSNLKQISISHHVWAADQNDRFPMEVSTRDGGTKEFIGSQPVFRFFQVLSNELATPLVLLCPKDKERIGMTNFTLDFDNSNISYFLGVDATRTNTTMFLSGDRNLENGLPVKRGLLTLTTNVPVSWTRKMHDKSGNVSFPDGSVQPLSTPALRSALAATGVATNRLAMP